MAEKELALELLGIHGLNSFVAHNSSSRSVMFANHIAQRLVTSNPDSKRAVTGLENKFSKYTFDIKMPADGKILKVIHRYPTGIDQNSLAHNPETIVIFENNETKEIDCFSIVDYNKFHQFFGYSYRFRDKISQIRSGAFIAKGTVFASPPSVGDNNEYKFGFNAKVAFMSLPAVSEDGVIIRKGFLEKLSFKVYETRTIEFGSANFPLNVYGSINNYKPFPDIGDYIREDGILMALRDYDVGLSPVDTSISDTIEIDYIFDKLMFTRAGKGRVIDIKVNKNPAVQEKTPGVITKFLDRYECALNKHYRELVDFETKLRNENRNKYGIDKLKLGRNLHKLLTEAYVGLDIASEKHKQALTLLYRKSVLNEYRVTFTIEYDLVPTVGYKLTCVSGGRCFIYLLQVY